MMMAPTSAAARPNPASSAVTRLKAVPDQRRDAAERAEIHRGQFVAVFEPEILDGLPRQRGDDGATSTVCAMIMARGVNNRPNDPSGPARESAR